MATFDDLKFKTAGCCGDHESASVTHKNGLRTQVDETPGGYMVCTWSGGTLFTAAQFLRRDQIDARLQADADRDVS